MKYKWTVEFEVTDDWVAGGFEITSENAKEMLFSLLPRADDYEIDARVIQAPRPEEIAKEQGYQQK